VRAGGARRPLSAPGRAAYGGDVRLRPHHPPRRSRAQHERIRGPPGREGIEPQERDTQLAFLRRQQRLASYYQAARELAHRLAHWSKSLPRRKQFLVCSGGGTGIMEAANRGAYEAGARSLALGISLPFEQGVNVYATPELSFEFHYFFIRKFWFFYLSKALIAFPGGFGTLDELFEMLTLIQTRKAKKHVPIILFGSEFWSEVVNFEALAKWGTISPEDISLFKMVDTVDEAMTVIEKDFAENYLLEPDFNREAPESSEAE
jgi:uncharacterized protein (TIGR00730 family)